MENDLDEFVQKHQEKESAMEVLINSQVKQLKSLLNCLNKRREALGEEKGIAESEEVVPTARARSETGTSHFMVPAIYEQIFDEEEENEEENEACTSEDSFKSASDE